LEIEETLQLAAQTAGVGTWQLFVLEGELHSSPRCKEIFGLSPEDQFQYKDFISSTVTQALDPKGTGLYELDYRINHPDGTVRWLGGKGKAFFEERNGEQVATRFIGTVIDRTERRKVQAALIEAEKLAVTGRLAASIAHEIRSPLESILNLLYLVRSESSEAKRSEYIQQAESELGRVSEIAWAFADTKRRCDLLRLWRFQILLEIAVFAEDVGESLFDYIICGCVYEGGVLIDLYSGGISEPNRSADLSGLNDFK
jgi:hypothetical protein